MPTQEKRISVTLTSDLHVVLLRKYNREYKPLHRSYSAMIRDLLYLALASEERGETHG